MDFKGLSKVAQALVKDSSQSEVNTMLEELRTTKERFVVIRRIIPERQKPLKTLLPHIESLETGISDLQRWLDSGSQLLSTHRIDGNINMVEERLEKHKVWPSFTN